jgi:hypothetical protein
LCDRWKKVPDEIKAIEDAPELLRMLRMEQLAMPEGGEQEWPEM